MVNNVLGFSFKTFRKCCKIPAIVQRRKQLFLGMFANRKRTREACMRLFLGDTQFDKGGFFPSKPVLPPQGFVGLGAGAVPLLAGEQHRCFQTGCSDVADALHLTSGFLLRRLHPYLFVGFLPSPGQVPRPCCCHSVLAGGVE